MPSPELAIETSRSAARRSARTGPVPPAGGAGAGVGAGAPPRGGRWGEARRGGEPLRLVPQRLVGGPIRGDDSVAQGLEIALQVRQWCPQLVCGVGDEVS